MTPLSDPGDLGRDPVARRAARARQRSELEIYGHALTKRVACEIDRIDSESLAEVTKHALKEEMAVLDEGLQAAGDSQGKAELVSRKVNMLSNLNTARIERTWRS